jgi:flagellar hook-associated protein 2
MAITSSGIGSGLDVDGIVSKLMAVESQPLTQLTKKEVAYQAKLSAYGNLKSALSSFQGALSSLNGSSRFTGLSASVGDSSILSASASSIASPSTHTLEVTQLSQAQSMRTNFTAANVTDVVGTGKLTFYFGTDNAGVFTPNPDKGAQTVTIDPEDNTLAGVRDAINSANVGVSASIVNDGTTNRLVLTSASGADNSLKIAVEDDDGSNTDTSGLSQLAYDPAGVKNMVETLAAKDATVIVDGITINNPTNQISTAIQGVTLNLTKTNIGEPTSVTISRDTGSVTSAVEGFVKAYNDLSATIKELTAYDAKSKTAGVLLGDSVVRSIQSQVRGVLNTAIRDLNGDNTTLSSVGVSFQRDGTLKLDSGKLSTAVNSDPTRVAGLFASIGKAEDSLVRYTSATSSTLPGSYALTSVVPATQGSLAGAAAAGLAITAGVNDTLSMTVDGVSASVTLAAGAYTASTLLAEVQSKINGASAFSSAAIGVTVSESGGVFTITSNRWGSASSVAVGGNGADSLLGAGRSATAGIDVSGKIGGQEGTGSGQFLTGTNGLKIEITGGAAGDRGSVNFARGYAYSLNSLLDGLLSSSGPIDSRTSGVNISIEGLQSKRETMERRLSDMEKRYRAQFTRLDQTVSQMTSTSNYLAQQLANLPKIGE